MCILCNTHDNRCCMLQFCGKYSVVCYHTYINQILEVQYSQQQYVIKAQSKC
uniref:Uncharacterized protein n=1 Tax=Anguilla anguilla TaxID=7936 RepID=A0A0E9UWK5_ANGAN